MSQARLTSFMVARTNRSSEPVTLPAGPVAYTPEWVAACYGVTPGEDCPPVTVEFPQWALDHEADRVVTEEEAITFTVAEANRHSLRSGPA